MHLAEGDIDVERGTLAKGTEGVDQTVEMMVQMAQGEYGAKSAKLRALAINIVNAAQVGDKDYYGMAKAIHNWVRDEIRYVKDPIGQETLSYPEETAFNSKAGDCLEENTRLLTPTGYVAIKDAKPGMTIQGRKGWTKIVKAWDKGILPVKTYHLDNGGNFTATDDHRCFLLEGEETAAANLRLGDALLGPAAIMLPEKRGSLSEDDCYFIGIFLADGWAADNKVCISGKDGFAKEAQKHWAKTYAEQQGWRTNWQPRYLTVYIPKDHPLYAFFHSGKLAPEKSIPDSVLAELTPTKLRRLLDGLLADSYQPLSSQRTIGAEKLRKRQVRSGVCYSTTSHDLAKQVRLLFRLTGVSVRDSLIVDHGGLGTHPVHRIYPRYYRPKPAKVEEVNAAGLAHCYDIATVDRGIYLPDADVVVHNCDDKVILEIGMLGSIGIRAYPVVVGVRPGHFSHVYLNIIIPDGGRPGTHAGDHIPADPIMREWPLGQEAPAHKITQKKTYEDLAGLDTMLGAYQTGPSYLDERNTSSVERAMNAALVDTASRGEILNAPKVTEHNTDELDQMFMEPAALVMQSMPWRRLGPDGPITGAEAAGSYSDDTTAPKYTVERAKGLRSFPRRARRVQSDLPGIAPSGVMRQPPSTSPEDDVAGLGVYIDSIIGGALNGEPAQNAIVAHLAERAACRASYLPGLGGAAAQLAQKAKALDALAKAGTNGDIYDDARCRLKDMERRGMVQ